MSDVFECNICGDSKLGRTIIAREMMFGFKDKFTYSECAGCGSLHLDNPLDDTRRYYPSGYYSFAPDSETIRARNDSYIKRYLMHKRSEYIINGKSLVGMVVSLIKPVQGKSALALSYIKQCGAGFNSKILDVGCGAGNLLLCLERLGFKDLTGIDPYVEKDTRCGSGVRIEKKELKDVRGAFDTIMMHHSLEHMDSPLGAFIDIARLLKKSGRAIIRTPIAQSYAWKYYGADWVQLDPPRHKNIVSIKGVEILAKNTGLKIEKIEFDSYEFQFIGSEQYRRDIPLRDVRSYFESPDKSIFSKDDIAGFRKRAAELNRERMGDQAAIYLSVVK